eukprot:2936497-Rhodomonas_salina.1
MLLAYSMRCRGGELDCLVAITPAPRALAGCGRASYCSSDASDSAGKAWRCVRRGRPEGGDFLAFTGEKPVESIASMSASISRICRISSSMLNSPGDASRCAGGLDREVEVLSKRRTAESASSTSLMELFCSRSLDLIGLLSSTFHELAVSWVAPS